MGLKGNGKWAMHTKTCKGIRRVLKAHAASFSVRMLLSFVAFHVSSRDISSSVMRVMVGCTWKAIFFFIFFFLSSP